MHKILGFGLSLFMFGYLATPASAHSPTAYITSVNGIPATSGFVSLRIPRLPYTVPVGGVLEHGEPGTITSTWLSLSDNFLDFFSPTHYFIGAGNQPTGAFTVPWTIDVAGMHFLQANATHGKGGGGATGASMRSFARTGLHIEVAE